MNIKLKSIALAVSLAVGSTAAMAGKINYGNFGGFEVYRLDFKLTGFNATQLCGIKGWFPDKNGGAPFKMVLAAYNNDEVKFFIEHEGWSLPANYSSIARIKVLDLEDDVSYDQVVPLTNPTPNPVKLMGMVTGKDFVIALTRGKKIVLYNANNQKFMYLEYGAYQFDAALLTMINQCIPTFSQVYKVPSYRPKYEIHPAAQVNPFE